MTRVGYVISVFMILLCPGLTQAQTFVANEGFSRPFLLTQTPAIPGIALAADNNRVFAYWFDREGVLRRDISTPQAELERVTTERGIRAVYATTLQGDAVITRVRRDVTTGRTDHIVSWRNEERVLLESLAPVSLSVAVAPDGPVILYSQTTNGTDRLMLTRWDGSRSEVSASSDEGIAKASVVFDEAGNAHVAWLQGFTDRQAVGFAASSWQAYYRVLFADGRLSHVVRLGEASNAGLQSRTVMAVSSLGPVVMWPDASGRILYQLVSLDTAVQAFPGRLDAGVPLGVLNDSVYWASGELIKREPIAGSNVTRAGPAAFAAQTLVWSANSVELAAATMLGDEVFIGWYGPWQGGGYALFAANTTHPLVLNWKDRIAALMGWNPWFFWQAFAGQLVSSVLIAVLSVMVLALPVWLISIVLARRINGNGALSGLLLSIVIVIALFAAGIALSYYVRTGAPIRLSITGSLIGLLLAVALTYLSRRNSQAERQFNILVTALYGVFLALCLLVFINFSSLTSFWSTLFI